MLPLPFKVAGNDTLGAHLSLMLLHFLHDHLEAIHLARENKAATKATGGWWHGALDTLVLLWWEGGRAGGQLVVVVVGRKQTGTI